MKDSCEECGDNPRYGKIPGYASGKNKTDAPANLKHEPTKTVSKKPASQEFIDSIMDEK